MNYPILNICMVYCTNVFGVLFNLRTSVISAPLPYSTSGLNKHFHMICIQNRLSQALGFTVSAKDIWDHLYSLYDIDALDEVEAIPFSLEEKEFKLPEDLKVVKRSSRKEPAQAPEQPLDKDGMHLHEVIQLHCKVVFCL